jgi:hypothetical protein
MLCAINKKASIRRLFNALKKTILIGYLQKRLNV